MDHHLFHQPLCLHPHIWPLWDFDKMLHRTLGSLSVDEFASRHGSLLYLQFYILSLHRHLLCLHPHGLHRLLLFAACNVDLHHRHRLCLHPHSFHRCLLFATYNADLHHRHGPNQLAHSYQIHKQREVLISDIQQTETTSPSPNFLLVFSPSFFVFIFVGNNFILI